MAIRPALKTRSILTSRVPGNEGLCRVEWLNTDEQLIRHDRGITGYFVPCVELIPGITVASGPAFHGKIAERDPTSVQGAYA